MDNLNRNDPCPCGSGKKYKKCHMNSAKEGMIADSANAFTEKYNEASRLYKTGYWGSAETACREAISIQKNNAPAHFLLGLALAAQNRKQEAIAPYQEAIRLQSNFLLAMGSLGQLYFELGNYTESEKIFHSAISTSKISISDKAILLGNLGGVLSAQGKHAEAVPIYQRSLSLNPDHFITHSNLGISLSSLGKLDEALSCYRKAISLKPDYAEGHNNLGVMLNDQRRHAEAELCFKAAIRLNENYLDAYKNLSMCLLDQNKTHEAEERIKTALSIKHDDYSCLSSLGDIYKAQRKMDAAIDCYKRAIQIKPDHPHCHHSLFSAMQFQAQPDPANWQAHYAQFRSLFEEPLKTIWQNHSNECDPLRTLNIGYVSPDFRNHAITKFIEPILINHDKSQHKIFCYYNNSIRDAVTDRLMGYSDQWLDCQAMTDAQLADQIRKDGIDILVDLTGHLAGNRILMFAHKPAPIQITYLGYPGSTGLSAIDYRLTDEYADPVGAEVYYTENLLRLPDSLWCYRPTQALPEIEGLPAQRNGYITFGSLNNFSKIDAGSVKLWAQLLHEIPNSRLLIATVPEGKLRQDFIDSFANQGIEESRLAFVGFLDSESFYKTIQQVDIALDPLLVNGATTTCEALWLGVPTLSLIGERFLSRAGFSILHAAGLSEFAAETQDDYLRIAKYYAANLAQLAEIRAGLREKVSVSALAADQAFTKNLEKAYRKVWASWCNASEYTPPK